VDYLIGTMIEIPRACVTADQIAKFADFFSFGTNDLTQTTFGFSRDDVEGKFMAHYLEEIPGKEGTPILKASPFEVLDREGVGELMRICVQKARSVKPDLEIGICGEHGGEPMSVWFCQESRPSPQSARGSARLRLKSWRAGVAVRRPLPAFSFGGGSHERSPSRNGFGAVGV
jgi:hypothetical protein